MEPTEAWVASTRCLLGSRSIPSELRGLCINTLGRSCSLEAPCSRFVNTAHRVNMARAGGLEPPSSGLEAAMLAAAPSKRRTGLAPGSQTQRLMVPGHASHPATRARYLVDRRRVELLSSRGRFGLPASRNRYRPSCTGEPAGARTRYTTLRGWRRTTMPPGSWRTRRDLPPLSPG